MKSDAGAGETPGGISGRRANETKRKFDWSGDVPEGVVCPACWGALGAGAKTLVCDACGRRYPVVDGIPALFVERAERG